ncbi:hypothetical protein VYU27_010305, partial [Nannochloropsis oceanica]
MYVFGGSTGSAMDDLHELNLEERRWRPIIPPSGSLRPGQRFCHVACVWKHQMLVFGGYDGSQRLNDFWAFKFGPALLACQIPEPSLLPDLRGFVNSQALSDVTFIVEGQRVYAHKILCVRSPYFRALFTGGMREAREGEVVLPDVRYPIFLSLLEYLYTDSLTIDLPTSFQLFEAADRFGVERLKKMCEHKMLTSLSLDNAAMILYTADVYHAAGLRQKCLGFILQNFDAVSKTEGFVEMGHRNVDLVFEILKKR